MASSQPRMMEQSLFYTQPPARAVHTRKVTAVNLHREMSLIRSLMPTFPFVAVDTQFPGVVHPHPRGAGVTADDRYAAVRANADELCLLQLGITLSAADGRLPVDGALVEFMWEFDFAGFDARYHRHAPESVQFLRAQGFDFEAARLAGVPALAFAAELAASGILGLRGVTWVAFGGMYDVAFLLRLATGGAAAGDEAGLPGAGRRRLRHPGVRRQAHGVAAPHARRPRRRRRDAPAAAAAASPPHGRAEQRHGDPALHGAEEKVQ